MAKEFGTEIFEFSMIPRLLHDLSTEMLVLTAKKPLVETCL